MEDYTPEQLRSMAAIELDKWEEIRTKVAESRDAAWSNYQDLRKLYERINGSVFRLEIFTSMLDQEEFENELL